MTPQQHFETIVLNSDILLKHPNNIERRKYVRSLLTPDLIQWLYIDQQMSANSIYQYLASRGLKISGADQIIRLVKEYLNIEPRTISQAAALPTTRNKYKTTVAIKYGKGIVNVSQSLKIKQKKEKTFFKKYGVSNAFKSPEIKHKIKQYWIDNFGVEHPSELKISHSGFRLSKPHKRVVDMLIARNIICETEENKYFKGFNPILEKRFCPRVDIYIPSAKLVIEVNGCYWHAKPTLYNPTDVFNTVYGPLQAQQIWERDKIKMDHIKRLGFNIEVIWDDEITQNKVDEILKKYNLL